MGAGHLALDVPWRRVAPGCVMTVVMALGAPMASAQDAPASDPLGATQVSAASDALDATLEPAEASAEAGANEAAPEQPPAIARVDSMLREAETRSRRLKEDIFRSKATLALLEELLVESATLGSGVRISHVNDLTRGYAVRSLRYYLDGKQLYVWDVESGTPFPEELELRNESVASGEHIVQVIMELTGRGSGVFNYVEDYVFTLKSSEKIDVAQGRVTTVRVLATSRAKGASRWEDRPRIVYQASVVGAEAE